jgi:hypothetical protein
MLPAAIMEMRANYTAPACKWHHHPPRLVIGLINRTHFSLDSPTRRALFLATRQLGIQKETEELSSLARRPDAFF